MSEPGWAFKPPKRARRTEMAEEWERAFPGADMHKARDRWRAQEPTDYQWRTAHELGVRVSEGDTRGEVADMIAARLAELADGRVE